MHTHPYHPLMQKEIAVALDKQFGGGHFGSKASHKARTLRFCDHITEYSGVFSLSDVTRRVVEDYAQYLKQRLAEGSYTQRSVVGLLSSVNVVLAQVRGDQRCWVSPSQCFGKVYSARKVLRIAVDPTDVVAAANALYMAGETRCAQVILACRFFGMRFRESLLADYVRLYREALQFKEINIIEGTKNGRSHFIDRWIDVDEIEIRILKAGLALQRESRNIIPAGLSLIQFARKVRREFDKVREQHRLTTFHELRAAYACDLYQKSTRFDAPVVAGRRLADRESDREARATISQYLGHGRLQVSQAYVGSSK